MRIAACWSGAVWSVICVLATASPAPGQSLDAATILYGHGVQAYFDGQFGEAQGYLSRAIASNPRDPRAYYFRGLSLLRLGDAAQGRADLQAGAAVEAERPNRYAVGSALARVQGGNRLLLEKYRGQAREQYALERQQVSRVRYEQMTRREADVLRRKVTVPLDQLVPPGEARSLLGSRSPVQPPVAPPPVARDAASPGAPAGGDPFADDPVASPPAATESTASPSASAAGPPASSSEPAPAEPAATVPAATATAPAQPPADDLFGAPADVGAAPAAATEDESDPFGFDGTNPFE